MGSDPFDYIINPDTELTIKNPMSISSEILVLKNVDKPDNQALMETIVSKIGNFRISEKRITPSGLGGCGQLYR